VFLEGGTYPAEPGHYRFRTERVYLPRRPVQMKKTSTNERVKLAKVEPAALLRTSGPHTVKAMCAAQYFRPTGNGSTTSRQFHDRNGQKEFGMPPA
jgi:hypothetical protein